MTAHYRAVLTSPIGAFALTAPCKVVDQCLQFFGGYGYMTEFPIARAYIDARITRIAGGAAEVMKQIIGRDLFSH